MILPEFFVAREPSFAGIILARRFPAAERLLTADYRLLTPVLAPFSFSCGFRSRGFSGIN